MKYIPRFLYPFGCALLIGIGTCLILAYLPLSFKAANGVPAAIVAIGILLIFIFSLELDEAIGAHLEEEW